MFPVQRHKGLMDIVNVLMAELLLPRQEKASRAQPLLHAPCCLSKAWPGHQPRRCQSCFYYKTPALLGNTSQFLTEWELRILGARRNHPAPPSPPAEGSQCTHSPPGGCCSADLCKGQHKAARGRSTPWPFGRVWLPCGPSGLLQPGTSSWQRWDGDGDRDGAGQLLKDRTSPAQRCVWPAASPAAPTGGEKHYSRMIPSSALHKKKIKLFSHVLSQTYSLSA